MNNRSFIAVFFAAAAASAANAAIISGLFNTGVDGSGNALAGGSPDLHYTVVSTSLSAVVMSSIPGSYIPNSSTSQWIWENADGQPTNVTRTFRLTFDLTGLDASTATLSGLWATDNAGDDILINGVSTGQTSSTFTSYSSFSVTSGFVAGLNTLDFVVRDVGYISGFRVDSLTGFADVPAPGALALLGTAGMLGNFRRRD